MENDTFDWFEQTVPTQNNGAEVSPNKVNTIKVLVEKLSAQKDVFDSQISFLKENVSSFREKLGYDPLEGVSMEVSEEVPTENVEIQSYFAIIFFVYIFPILENRSQREGGQKEDSIAWKNHLQKSSLTMVPSRIYLGFNNFFSSSRIRSLARLLKQRQSSSQSFYPPIQSNCSTSSSLFFQFDIPAF